MKVSQRTKLRAAEAALVYAKNKNMSQTARELGIHRSTLERWQKEGLLEPEDNSDVRTSLSLDQRIAKAFEVIDKALEGDRVTPHQMRAALDVVKLSNALRAQERAEEAKQSLSELIASEANSD